MLELRQSTAVVIPFGPFVSPTDGVTLQTGLVSAIDHATTGIMLSKNGGTKAVRHASVTASTYDAYGDYKVTLDTTDTNTLGTVRVSFAAAASCAPVWVDCMVLSAFEYDRKYTSDSPQLSGVVDYGTGTAPDTTHFTLAALAFGTNVLAGKTLYVYSATNGLGSTVSILSNTNATPSVCAIEALPVALTGTLKYMILPSAPGTAAGIQAIWDALTANLTTADSVGKLLKDNIDAAISSRLSTAGYTAPPDTGDVYALLTGTNAAPTAPPTFPMSIVTGIKWFTFLWGRFSKHSMNKDTGAEALRNVADSTNVAAATNTDNGTTTTIAPLA